MKKSILLAGLLVLSNSAMAKDTITCALKAFNDADADKTVLLASETQPSSPYGVNFFTTSANKTMTFAASLGHTTSLIITDEKTGRIYTSFFKGAVYMNSGALAHLVAHDTTEGSVILNCEREF